MAKWIVAEKVWVRLRHEVVCLKVTGRAKERIDQRKRARGGSLVKVDQPEVVRTRILRADVVLSFSGVTSALFLFLFRFRVLAFIKAAAFNRSSKYAGTFNMTTS